MKKRIFVAINLPEEIQNKILDFIESLGVFDLPVRWVKKKNIHLTLVFLGNVEIEKLEVVKKEVRKVVEKYHFFKLKVRDFGGFPDEKNPRILWVGPSDSDDLIELQRELVNKLIDLGFNIEDRGFLAHLTIGRTKARIKDFRDIKDKIGSVDLGEFEVKSIDIMKSELTKEGPIYKIIKKIKLDPH